MWKHTETNTHPFAHYFEQVHRYALKYSNKQFQMYNYSEEEHDQKIQNSVKEMLYCAAHLTTLYEQGISTQ